MTTPLLPFYCEIPLTRGMVAIIDYEDYELISKYKWHAILCAKPDYFYAMSSGRDMNRVLMHRLILGLKKGDLRRGDHINRSTLDNRRSNLRIIRPRGRKYEKLQNTEYE